MRNNDRITVNLFYYTAFFGSYHNARIGRNSTLYSRSYDRSFASKQRNCLSLHVGTHQGSVRIVVFKERYKRRCNRNQLLGRYVHIIYLISGKFGYFFLSSARNLFVYESVVFVQRFVRLRHDVSVFFVCGKIIYYVRNGSGSFIHSSIRRFDKSVFVYFRKGGQRGDKSYVLTFRRFDRTHSSVVRVVNVSDFESRSFSVQSSRSQRRQFSLMRKFRNRVGLIHKLRQLRRTEKFFYRRAYGTSVYEFFRGNFLTCVLGRHSLSYYPFKSGHTYSEYVL